MAPNNAEQRRGCQNPWGGPAGLREALGGSTFRARKQFEAGNPESLGLRSPLSGVEEQRAGDQRARDGQGQGVEAQHEGDREQRAASELLCGELMRGGSARGSG